MGNFASKQTIVQKLTSLKKPGYSPCIIEHPQKGYRLLVGAHVTREEADGMAGKLKEAGIYGKLVLR